MTTPIAVIREGIRAVPAVKYALGVAGIVGAVALIASFGLDSRIALFGAVLMLVLMTALVIFARLSMLGAPDFRLPALVFTWFSLFLVILLAATMFLSVFFRWPVDLQRWLTNPTLTSAIDRTPRPIAPDSAQPAAPQREGTLAATKPEPSPQPPSVKAPERMQQEEAQRKAQEEEARNQAQERHRKEEESAKLAEEQARQARRRVVADFFDRAKGRWVAKDSASKEMYDSNTALGQCTVSGSVSNVLVISEVDEDLLKGTFESESEASVDFTPARRDGTEDIARRYCMQKAGGSEDGASLSMSGTVEIALQAGGDSKWRPTINVTSCVRNGKTCPASTFGRKRHGTLEMISESKLKLGSVVYQRD